MVYGALHHPLESTDKIDQPMRLAILSDIHGNYDALKKVLIDMDGAGVDSEICLGDCIGYGPEPEETIREVMQRKIPSILGNHELAAVDPSHLNWFNPLARRSLEQTIRMLSSTSRDYISRLPFYRIASQARFVHGFPPESAQTYLFQKTAPELRKTFETMEERICFLGHTHTLEIIRYDGRQVDRMKLGEGKTQLDEEARYIVNVGSVGQPRDGTNHAKYAIWDKSEGTIEVRFIPYDIASTVEKIKAAGLPENHAKRLW